MDNEKPVKWTHEGPPLRQITEPGPACLHDQCTTCGGSGWRKDGFGICVHMISCQCQSCTPHLDFPGGDVLYTAEGREVMTGGYKADGAQAAARAIRSLAPSEPCGDGK